MITLVMVSNCRIEIGDLRFAKYADLQTAFKMTSYGSRSTPVELGTLDRIRTTE